MSLIRSITLLRSIPSARRSFSVSRRVSQQLVESDSKARAEGDALSRLERLMALSDSFSSKNGKGQLTSLRSVPMPGAQSKTYAPDATLPPLPTERRIQDSYVELDLKFSQDPKLRETYVGGFSQVRMGRLMEDFDSLAGAAAYRHVLPDGCKPQDASRWGVYLVTAAVDRMDVLTPLSQFDGTTDFRLSAHVAYATESSLEVFVRLSTIPAEGEQSTTILIGRFAMAARRYGGGKHPIAKLVVTGEAEQELVQMGKEMKEGKKARNLQSLERQPPSAEEAKMMHDLFIGRQAIFERNAPTPADVVWMSDTDVNSAQLMHPQESNVHGKIFGGYLMRLAYESAWSTACRFSRSPVTFIALDELQFASPVEIGSLLLLDSRVTFSPIKGDHKSFHVAVKASTTNLYTGEKKVTNVFHYTFVAGETLKRHVLPRSYKQAMSWLDGQRRRVAGINYRKGYSSRS